MSRGHLGVHANQIIDFPYSLLAGREVHYQSLVVDQRDDAASDPYANMPVATENEQIIALLHY